VVLLYDAEDCTPVPMRVTEDGAFFELTQANGGTKNMKLYQLSAKEPLSVTERGDFAESESVFLTTIVGNGHCAWPST
jgi:hypothetical protein